jgi:peptidoglycan/LPS O-acetylase OafA/YrhL
MKEILIRRDNNFNFLRLLFAIVVIFSHSPQLVDGNRHREPLTRLFPSTSGGDLALDCFFILSGFLIMQSWDRKPILLEFLKKRVLRIYPGFIVASLISVLIVGPLGANAELYFAHFNFLSFLMGLIFLQAPNVPPTFVGQFHPVLNGPLYTIAYEFRCYLLVTIFGICGLFKRRWV